VEGGIGVSGSEIFSNFQRKNSEYSLVESIKDRHNLKSPAKKRASIASASLKGSASKAKASTLLSERHGSNNILNQVI
jgi:hypothetical protein